MKPMTLNLSKMKKIGGDKNHSVFLHPSGHQIAIAHAGVSALQRKQLESLPVHGFDEGGDTSDAGSSESTGQDQGAPESYKEGLLNLMGAPIFRAIGNEIQAEHATSDPSLAESNNASQAVPSGDATQAVNQALSTDNQSRMPSDEGSTQEEPQPSQNIQMPPATSTATNDVEAPAAVENPMAKSLATMNAGFQAEKGTIQSALNEQQTASQNIQNAWSQYSDAVSKMPSPQEVFQQHQQQDQALMKAFADQKIDPNHFWNSRNDTQKIYAGIGMVLGGMGSALTHQPNMAMQVINNAINRDIEAQKSQQGKTLTLWQMNRQATNDDLQARLTTQNQMLAGVRAQVMGYAAQAGSAQAKMNAAPLLMQIDQQMAQNNMLRAVNSPSAAPGSEGQFVNRMGILERYAPEMYKDLQSKYVPGVGIARVPLQPEDRKALTSYDQLGAAIDDAIQFQKQHMGVGTIPGTAAAAAGNAKRDAIIMQMNTLMGLNRLNPQEFDTYKDMTPNPGSFFSSRAMAKLQELKTQIGRHQQAEMMHLGVVPFSDRQQLGSGGGPEIATRNGIQYQKVAGGWQRVQQ